MDSSWSNKHSSRRASKAVFLCLLSGYLVRRYEEVQDNIKGFIKPLVFFVAALLLLIQPDLGTVVVMFVTTVSLLFMAEQNSGSSLG